MDMQNAKIRQSEAALIEKSGEFDIEYYLSKYPDIAQSGINPIAHYVYFGASEGRNPNATFKTIDYQKEAKLPPDINPFVNYLIHKKSIELKTTKQLNQGYQKKTEANLTAILESGIFDIERYMTKHPGAVNSAIYKSTGPELGAIAHYLKHSLTEGQSPCDLFDNRYYTNTYKDVVSSGMNPLIHYINHGWKELRNPSRKFDTAWYWLVHQSGEADCINPLSHFFKLGKEKGHSTKPKTQNDFVLLDRALDQLIEQRHPTEELLFSISQYLRAIGSLDSIEKIYREILKINPDFQGIHNLLAKLYADRGLWWQAIESLCAARISTPHEAEIVFRLGEAYEKMNNFSQAATAFSDAIKLDSSNYRWHYRHGYTLQKIGKQSQAEIAFSKAIELDPNKTTKIHGIGAYDQERGYWKDAALAYERQLTRTPREAELHYRLGMALDRCYKWKEASESYETAISLDPSNAYWHYRLGFVQERLKNYDLASEMYNSAAALSTTPMPEWNFRQGYVLQKTGRFEQACCAYLKSSGLYGVEEITAHDLIEKVDFTIVSAPPSRSHLSTYADTLTKAFGLERTIRRYSATAEDYFNLGEEYANLGNWANAANSYNNAILRSNNHRGEWYYKLGASLFRNRSFEEACNAFSQATLLNRPYGVNFYNHQKNAKTLQRMVYAEYLHHPIRTKTIIYESYLAASMACNPLAIFKSLLNDQNYSGWLHVWVINNNDVIPSEFCLKENVIFIQRQSDAYSKYLAIASHLINNVTFPEWFIRREGQQYLNTWHGTPIKHLGTDIRDEFMAHKNVSRNFLHATHLLSPNEHTSDIMLKKYDIDGIYSGVLAETGYPRVDSTVNMPEEKKKQVLEKMGLESSRPVVLYAPTWRGLQGQAEVDVEKLKADIGELAKLSYQVVFRGHHFSESSIAGLNLPVAIADQSIDTGDLLAIVDLLITDYSSIFFDFLPTKRPVIFYLYDLAEYTKTRGLYFDHKQMPGEVCETIEATIAATDRLLGKNFKPDQKYKSAMHKFCSFDDGKATQRAIDFFFSGCAEHVVKRYADDRKSLIFYPGTFVPNGITSSCINLLSNLPEKDYQISIVIDPTAVAGTPERLQKYEKLPRRIHTIARVGQMVMTPEEAWLLDRFNTHRQLETPEMWEVLTSAFKREYQRMLSVTEFTSIINFEGYSYFWSSLLGLGKPDNSSSTIFLHNDMRSEWEVRHPYLAGIFALYAHYDSLISVSETMKQINQDKLGKLPELSPNKFGHCINTINPDEIIARANSPIDEDLISWIGDSNFFITLGRLSPEKDQAKLIRALHLVKQDHSEVKLIILGDGPLKARLESLIIELDLEDNVLLGGLRENPFPILKRAECFVLPSNHEGQPMVLLESMALGKPIVATNIDGNRGVLKNGYGELVENSINGLALGLNKFIAGRLKHKHFDADNYMTSAIAMFKKNIDNAKIVKDPI